MSPMIGAPPDADAEARVKAIIAQLGGGRALMQSMAAYREVVNRMPQEVLALVKSHPKKWAAMAPGTAPVIGDSHDAVLAEVAALTAGDLTGVVAEYLAPDPPALIL